MNPALTGPGFGSTQRPYRLQIAGHSQADDDTLVQGDPAGAKSSVLCFRDGVLAAVESVNMAARKLLGAGSCITRTEADAEGSP